jgi:V/A-type H+-transporting ATPase subunit E
MDTVLKPVEGDCADGLCVQIMRDAQKEAGEILDRAKAQVDQILSKNSVQIEEMRRQMLDAAHIEAAALERKILSMVNLETRRTILTAREKVLEQVMDGIKARAAGFRSSSEYPQYLKQMIVQGALVLDCDRIDVLAAACDKNILVPSFLDEIKHLLKEKYSKDIILGLELSEDVKDIGVVLRSKDRKSQYDNTFGARLSRAYEDVRMGILKEMFGDNV